MGDTCIIDKHIDLRKMSKHFLSKSLYKRGITDIPGKGQDFEYDRRSADPPPDLPASFDFSGRPVPDDSPLWARLVAMARPIPREAPDTNATLYMIVLLLILSKFIFTIQKSRNKAANMGICCN